MEAPSHPQSSSSLPSGAGHFPREGGPGRGAQDEGGDSTRTRDSAPSLSQVPVSAAVISRSEL